MNLYCFDFFGNYLGWVDEHGFLYDSRGCRWARVSEDGRVDDLHGKRYGHIDLQGNFFTEQGVCRGYFRGWYEAFKRRFASHHALEHTSGRAPAEAASTAVRGVRPGRGSPSRDG